MSHALTRFVSGVALYVVGCRAPGAPEPPAPPHGSAQQCELVFRAHVIPRGDEEWRLLAVVENTSAQRLELTLPDRCPEGLIAFEGLPAGYDYYGTCNRGACPQVAPPTTFALAPGEQRELSSTVIRAKGTPPCASALRAGMYLVRPLAPAVSARSCVIGAALQITQEEPTPPPLPKTPPPVPSTKGPKVPQFTPPQPTISTPPDLPRVPPSTPSPPPPPFSTKDPYACQTASDCVLACPEAPGCCGYPCGCRHAINRAHAEAFKANYAKTCMRHPHCPVVGCAYSPASWAACVNGKCLGVEH